MTGLFWYFAVFTALGQAHFGVYPDEALCRMGRERLIAQLPDEVPSLTTPCAPATQAQLEGLGFRLPVPLRPDRSP